VLHRIARDLALLLSPALPFTADEIWPMIPGAQGSVHTAVFPAKEPPDEAVLARWEQMLDVRSAVTKALEEARAEKRIASSLEARVEVRGPASALEALRRHAAGGGPFPGDLANLFIVSAARLLDGEGPVSVTVDRAVGAKCERCWTYSEKVGRMDAHPGVCERCAEVLAGS
jgi:isoleucyl-tRNA synthetase